MNEPIEFSQPTLVNALCKTLARLNDAPELSGASLAADVAPHCPHIPVSVLRVLATKVIHLYFDPPRSEDIGNAGLDADEEAEASRFFANLQLVEANAMEAELARRRGGKGVWEGDLR